MKLIKLANRSVLAISVLFTISMPVNANSVYKCVDEQGNTAFQERPCSASSRSADQVKLESAPKTGWSQPSIEMPSASEEAIHRYNREIDASNARYDQAIEKIDAKNCQFYKDRLASTQERWAKVRRSGYKQWERDMWEQRIRDNERAVQREC